MERKSKLTLAAAIFNFIEFGVDSQKKNSYKGIEKLIERGDVRVNEITDNNPEAFVFDGQRVTLPTRKRKFTVVNANS